MPIAENIKKVAVIKENETTQFLDLDQGRPLAAIITDLCNEWHLEIPDDYALQFTEQNRQAYITERNRVDISNGNILRLTYSPAKTAQEILILLNANNIERKVRGLRQLVELSADNTFAQEFINKSGHFLLIGMVEGGVYSGDALAFTLKGFVELMNHGIVSWDVLEQKFIKTVAYCINRRSGVAEATILISALEILESVVLHSGKYSIVEQEVTHVSLIHHLQSSDAEIQKNAIALVNALFQKADMEKRKQIAESMQIKSTRNIILKNIIGGKASVGMEMAHQLYVLQSLLFNMLEESLLTEVEVNDQNALKEIMELRKLAFDSDPDPNATPTKKPSSYAKDYKKLGFQNTANPTEDLNQAPPGRLALDSMVYFAKNHPQTYIKVVLENSCRSDDHDCPFAWASIELIKMLAEILKVGEQPTEEGQRFHPMFFTHDRPFEEFYCLCIQLLNKTWRAMRATSADFTKVLSVVKEQISRSLEIQPATFDAFKAKLQHLTYNDITLIWQQERRYKEEWESQAKPVLELREQIKPEIMELIKQQRLNYLVEGTKFNKYSTGKRLKDKYMFCRLSPNHKVFHYGDCDEMAEAPALEQLLNKVPVIEIQGLVVGKDCPHVKEKGKKLSLSFPFSIITDVDRGESLNFIAPSETDFHIWTDGINALLGNPMTSKLTETDLETLLSMEIKLRLLDAEGITIPENPPPIPKPPNNYNFAYNI